MGGTESAVSANLGLSEPVAPPPTSPTPRFKVQWSQTLLHIGPSSLVTSKGIPRTSTAPSALLALGGIFPSIENEDPTAGESNNAGAAPPLSEVSRRLERYRTEVRGDHGLMTAVDSLYLTSLEYQRRLDLVEIQRATIQAQWASSRQSDGDKAAVAHGSCAEGGSVETDCWRRELDLKRKQAVEALFERAQSYVVGTRSTRSGLLQLATDSDSKQAVLQRFKDTLEEEYAAGAAEIEASIEMVASMEQQQYDAYLLHMQRSAEFWEAELESTFNDWETASRRYYRVGEREKRAWEELSACCTRLLEWLRTVPVPRAPRNDAAQWLVWQTEDQERGERSLLEACSRFLEIELEQAAHGRRNKLREDLLLEMLEVARSRNCFPGVGHHLLRNADFCALASLQPDGSDRPVLDAAASHGQPWAAYLRDIFGALLIDLAITGQSPSKALDVGLLCKLESSDVASKADSAANTANSGGSGAGDEAAVAAVAAAGAAATPVEDDVAAAADAAHTSDGGSGETPVEPATGEDGQRLREGWGAIRRAAVSYADNSRERRTALHEALLRGRIGFSRLLVEARANPGAVDATGLTAIAIASRYSGGEDMSLEFLKAAQRLSQQEASLLDAARRGVAATCVTLLDARASLECREEATGRMPLHLAAAAGHAETVRKLLAISANPDVQDNDGARPLHLAATAGSAAVAAVLLEARANPDATDAFGSTPVHFAAHAPSVAAMLVRMGSSTQAHADGGFSPACLSKA